MAPKGYEVFSERVESTLYLEEQGKLICEEKKT
jgi:hypothetical protein